MGELLQRLLRKEPKQLQTIERMPLGGQHAMHLVRVGEKLLLVVTGPGCCEVREVE
jgi:flagellar biogenesis protein FliO